MGKQREIERSRELQESDSALELCPRSMVVVMTLGGKT